MLRATQVMPAGTWNAAAVDTVTLDYDHRHRRRTAMTGAGGLAFILDLAEAFPLREGDGLVLEDGRIVAVAAAPEPLAAITADSAPELMRIAWHLGNRHLPSQLEETRILIRRDHVIEHMVEHLGGTVQHTTEAFDPEGGAYGGGGHGHHHHDHDAPDPALGHDDRDEDADGERS